MKKRAILITTETFPNPEKHIGNFRKKYHKNLVFIDNKGKSAEIVEEVCTKIQAIMQGYNDQFAILTKVYSVQKLNFDTITKSSNINYRLDEEEKNNN
jgi:hypothetical protein